MPETTPKTNVVPAAKTATASKKKVYKSIAEGRLYVKSTFNNTLVNITDAKGNSLCWSSAGNCGFKGARKSTPYAATTAIEKTLDLARNYGIKKISVYLSGPGVGRDATLRFLRTKRDFDVEMISDVTPIPHNGPRPPKQRHP